MSYTLRHLRVQDFGFKVVGHIRSLSRPTSKLACMARVEGYLGLRGQITTALHGVPSRVARIWVFQPFVEQHF